MRATALNHVSIPATDVERSCRFYQDVFAMERLAAPNFGFAVAWLRLGDLELHLYHVDEQPGRTYQHLGFEVDDFEACYIRLKELELFEEAPRFRNLYELPGGEVQMYFRDPDDNLLEVDWPDVSTLDRSVFGDDLKLLADVFPQSEENLRASLFLRARESARA